MVNDEDLYPESKTVNRAEDIRVFEALAALGLKAGGDCWAVVLGIAGFRQARAVASVVMSGGGTAMGLCCVAVM